MMPAIYGNAYDITQAPGMVAIRYEMVHETRIIKLDNSPRSGQRTHMGDAVATGKATRSSSKRRTCVPPTGTARRSRS